MNNTVYLIAATQYHCHSSFSMSELKGHLKKQYQLDGRRLSRLSLLALAGAMPLAPYAHAHTAIHAAAYFGSPSVYQSMMDNVFEHAVAKPFDLLAHLHNAPAFHVATAVGSHETTVFQAISPQGRAWQNPLRCAANDLIAGSCSEILLGWCFEAGVGEQVNEGSVWVMLSQQPQINSIAFHLSDGLLHEPADSSVHYLQQVQQWLQTQGVVWLE